MARKPRFFDPRTGYLLGAAEHRALLAYAIRQHEDAVRRWRQAEDQLERLKRRSAVRRWQRRAAAAYTAMKRWKDIIRRLEDQLYAKVIEYEAKFPYEGRQQGKNDNQRANVNVRMRWHGRRVPNDREVRSAFAELLGRGVVKRGWQYAVIDWRNDRRGKEGWAIGEWRGGGGKPDVEGKGPLAGERQDIEMLEWVHNIWIGGDLRPGDLDTLIIGEVEED